MSLLSFRVRKRTDIDNLGIVPGLGRWQELVYVFWGVIPYGREKHKQNSPDNCCMLWFVMAVNSWFTL